MNYGEMNRYDIASVLLNLIDDDSIGFCVTIQGHELNILDVDIIDGEIVLEARSSDYIVTIRKRDEED